MWSSNSSPSRRPPPRVVRGPTPWQAPYRQGPRALIQWEGVGKPNLFTAGIGSLLHEFAHPATKEASSDEDITIRNLQAISSYSWSEAKFDEILVPGTVPIWQNVPMPFRLPPDSANAVMHSLARAPNGFHEPTIRAILKTNPNYPIAGCDIISDRNNLRKLLSYAASETVDRELRIDVSKHGKTVLLARWEAVVEERPVGNVGYNRAFEEQMTVLPRGAEPGIGHSRIVTYEFAGMKLLVRFDVDACLAGPTTSTSANKKSSLDELFDSLHTRSLGNPVQKSSDASNITVRACGALVPQRDLIKIKTRSTRTFTEGIDLGSLVQLYLSGTPHLYVGIHQGGRFERLVKTDVASAVRGREREAGLGKLVAILQDIVRVVRLQEKEEMSLLLTPGKPLRLFERGKGKALPQELRDQVWGKRE